MSRILINIIDHYLYVYIYIFTTYINIRYRHKNNYKEKEVLLANFAHKSFKYHQLFKIKDLKVLRF